MYQYLTECETHAENMQISFVFVKRAKLPVVFTTDRSKVAVPMLFLFCVALQFTLRGASCLVWPCSLSKCCFCPFSILITLLGEEGAGLCAYRAFVC